MLFNVKDLEFKADNFLVNGKIKSLTSLTSRVHISNIVDLIVNIGYSDNQENYYVEFRLHSYESIFPIHVDGFNHTKKYGFESIEEAKNYANDEYKSMMRKFVTNLILHLIKYVDIDLKKE